MAGVIFSFSELMDELNAMSDLARGFVEPESESLLKTAANQLLYLKRSSGGVWEVSREQPIKTILSIGNYDMNSGAAHSVYATMSWTWSIRPIANRRKRKGSAAPATKFILNGNASTKVDIYLAAHQVQRILTWTMDIADGVYPGSAFHIQIKDIPGGGASEFDVPRIPCMLLTPSEQLDFLLGELFQGKWLRRQLDFFANQFANVRIYQEQRTKKLFDAMSSALSLTEQAATPWQRLKSWKPDGLQLSGDAQ